MLLEGYAAPSTSAIRARSIATAKDHFARYTAIIKPEAAPGERLDLPDYTPQGLEAAFPFVLHQPRAGEPSIAVPAYGGSENEIWLASEDYTQRRREFAAWASRQPDSSLLLIEDKQRYRWLTEATRLRPETFFNWWRERKFAAKMLMRDGQESILDTYWTANRELRVAAPQRYVQDRILAKHR